MYFNKAIDIPKVTRVVNLTGATIAKGSVVYPTGANGSGSEAKLTVAPAKADKPETCLNAIGVLSEDIAHGSEGQCVISGVVNGFDESGSASGTELFISDTTAGDLVASVSSNLKIRVGTLLVYSDTNAYFFVDIKNKSTVKNNYSTSAPSTSDDNTKGYQIGSIWYTTISSVTTPYVCLSNSTSNAVWSILINPYTIIQASEKAGLADNDLLPILDSAAGYVFKSAKFANFQAKLVSGTNIKTINGSSVLGSGDLTISSSVNWGSIGGTLSNQTDLQTALDGKQASLGFTAENVANKETTALDTSTTKYPCNGVVKTALDLKAALASPALTGSPTAPTQSANDNSTKIATTAYVDTSTAPVGQIIMWPLSADPSNGKWVELEGQLAGRTSGDSNPMPELWNLVNSSGDAVSEASWSSNNQGKFSTGDGSTNFRLPDTRAMFIRGLDGGRGIDSGRALGSYQADAVGSHTHTIPATFAFGYAWSVVGGTAGFLQSGSTNTGSTGGGETLTKNLAYRFLIKYKM